MLLYDLIHEHDWAPESYVAFVEGLRWLQQQGHIGEDVVLPVLKKRGFG